MAGVTSAGVTAGYAAEATEASDNSPTLGQPIVQAEKAQAFIPFSIEIGQDWAGFSNEIVTMLREAKDNLEVQKFTTGLGTASNEPEGLLVGGTAIVTTAGTASLAAGDIYNLKAALPPRFQANARFIGSGPVFDKVRQLTGPGSDQFPVWNDLPTQILRRPAHEVSAYPQTLASAGSILTIGDFSRMLVVDRIGMSVEIISHLFGTANNRPTGQRGVYCYFLFRLEMPQLAGIPQPQDAVSDRTDPSIEE